MVLSCMGLMADLYDMSVINLIRPSLVAEFGEMTPSQDAMVTGSVLVGAVVGQVLFGGAADYCGRYVTFVLTAVIVFLSALAASLAQDGFLGINIYTFLTVCRFTMGVGIGGEYPLSATNTVENVDAQSSSFALAFAMSGMSVGALLGPVVVLVMTAGLGLSDGMVWRLALGFAAFMAGLSAILRWLLLGETKSFRESATDDCTTKQRGSKGATEMEESKFAALWAMRWSLMGTAGSWFLYNIVTFGTGLFSTSIFHSAAGSQSAIMLVLLGVFSLPGVFASLILVQHWSMRDIQMLGLGIMALCFLGMSFALDQGTSTPGRLNVPRDGWVHYLCIVLFALNWAADAMGPTVPCYAVPAQIYPTRIRGIAHGISAAVGKSGAVVGTFLFPFLQRGAGIEAVLSFMTVACVLSVFWTWVFTPGYVVTDYDRALQSLKGLSLVKQAQAAERTLFATEKEKEEVLPISS